MELDEVFKNDPSFADGDLALYDDDTDAYVDILGSRCNVTSGDAIVRLVLTTEETTDKKALTIRGISASDNWDDFYYTAVASLNSGSNQIVGAFSYSSTILNTTNSEPVSGAIVQVFAVDTTSPIVASATTNSAGVFILYSDNAGPYDIRVYKDGFEVELINDVTFTEQ